MPGYGFFLGPLLSSSRVLVACSLAELQQKLRGCSGQWKDSFGQSPSSLWSGHISSNSSFNHGFRQRTCFLHKSQSLARPSQAPLRMACLLHVFVVRLTHSSYQSGELATVLGPWLDSCCVRLQLYSSTHPPQHQEAHVLQTWSSYLLGERAPVVLKGVRMAHSGGSSRDPEQS